jgi:hypothetical protein
LFQGSREENDKIAAEKDRIGTETRREYTKIGDVLENFLLQRQKIGMIACLELLAETGAFSALLENDPRYQNFLIGYFKRNNLAEEIKNFQSDPGAEKYVRYFVKYIFMERLGLVENEAARWGARLSNIFRSIGSPLKNMAYLDMADYKFKWNE